MPSNHLIPSSPSPPAFNLPSIRVFSSVLALRIKQPNYCNFCISPSNEYSELISFKTDWFDSPCSPRDSQKFFPAPQFKSINSSGFSLLYGPILISIHDNWKNHSLDYQFSSVAQSCPTLCDPMNHSMPGLPVHHQLPEFTQTHVHRVSDAIQPSHPLLSPSPPALNPSQHQSLFQ